MKLYPLKFEPILKSKVWGGNKIPAFKSFDYSGEPIGESWELSAFPGDESVVAEGELKGMNILELIDAFGVDLLGTKAYAASLTPRGAVQGVDAPRNVSVATPGAQTTEDRGRTALTPYLAGRPLSSGGRAAFPLLFKFIDAGDDLSVQVHPDDALAQSKGYPYGKTEMWYVIDADPGAKLFSGFCKETAPEEFRGLALDGGIMDRLGSYDVHPGDVFFLPAGRVHAIGKGCFVAEIQQSSDSTYRIYDYNRLGLDGRPRALHIDSALQATDFTIVENAKSHPDVPLNTLTPLVHCDYFKVSVLRANAWVAVPCKAGESFTVLMCTEGSAEIEAGIPDGGPTKGHRVAMRRGETVLIPASATTIKVLPSPEATLLVVTQ